MVTAPSNAKILVLDIETQPALADVWRLWRENIPLARLRQPTEMLCFAAKWFGADWSIFYSQWNNGQTDMVKKIHELLDEADVVVHYNGKRFDVPHINREIARQRLAPPSPYKQVDLYQVVKSTFAMDSNKLQHLVEYFSLGEKEETGGYELWRGVMDGDPASQAQMQKYNLHDVTITEQAYLFLRPWIRSHPNMGLFVDLAVPVCRVCQGTQMQRRGHAITAQGMFQRYRCMDCGAWGRSGQKVNSADQRGIS